MTQSRFASVLGAAAVLSLCAVPVRSRAQQTVADSIEIVGTVQRFHSVIAAGDSLAALALLTEDAIILESGGLETKAQFRDHHLPADISFAQSTKAERRTYSVTRRGDVAWVASTSGATGTFGGRAINSMGAELMVLVLTPSGWRISAIHWSSRARRP
jgi:ketosteroid isomerase-like protein